MSLPVREFHAKGYRSLKTVAYPMSDLDVFVGPNGIGKTNLYRALELLQAAATNDLARHLSKEGGLDSAYWAGSHGRKEPVRIKLAAGFGDPEQGRSGKVLYRYEVAIGYPAPSTAAFAEPHIKEEAIVHVNGKRQVRLLDRNGPCVMMRGEDGRPAEINSDLLDSETVLGRVEDPSRYPELAAVRRTLLQWRFYHGFRMDAESPLRQPCAAVATPSLASDGADLAAVFATLAHIRGDITDLRAIVGEAFPGARLIVPHPERTASFGMNFLEFPNRVFEARELSDGTLRFLALAGALLAYRLPPFIALNEPEASLHPDLMEPLAKLIFRAAERTQIWLVTHSTRLADAVTAAGAGKVRKVIKQDGATQIEGLKSWGAFENDEE
jgi:predicted ATPase